MKVGAHRGKNRAERLELLFDLLLLLHELGHRQRGPVDLDASRRRSGGDSGSMNVIAHILASFIKARKSQR